MSWPSLPRGMLHDVQVWLAVLNNFDGYVPLDARAASPIALASDAFGQGDLAGIGGWFHLVGEPRLQSEVWWFSENYTKADAEWCLGDKPFQLVISALELLAAVVLIKLLGKRTSASILQLQLRVETDSLVAVHAQHRWYSPTQPLNSLLKELALFILRHDAAVNLVHIPGTVNTWADKLSRGHCADFDPAKRIR
eukprot:7672657-Karenia_brevis.AAC.1